MKPPLLSYEDFLKSLELCPRIAVELILENQQKSIFLIKRKKFPFRGFWHLPGGFLLKDEPIKQCIKRLLKDEVGATKETKIQFIGVFESINKDPRGHIIHYVVKIPTQSENINFFNRLPIKIISYQKDFLIKLGYK